jgi:hypothetical protein
MCVADAHGWAVRIAWSPQGFAVSAGPRRPDIYMNGYRRCAFKLEAQRLPFVVFPAYLDDLSIVWR